MRHFVWLLLLFNGFASAQISSGTTNAAELVQSVIRHRNTNDPQKKFSSFSLRSYTKLVVTANPDSIDGRIDSLFSKKRGIRTLKKLDSSEYKFKKVVERRHVFQTENVSNLEFDGKNRKEIIIGTKMAGLKEPIYEIVGFNLQSFSVYDEQFELFEATYVSPIADDAIDHYIFSFGGSTTIDDREVSIINFTPRKQRHVLGLNGTLYIDDKFAVAKAIMHTIGVLDITSTHDFSYLPQYDIWFPSSKKFKIVKGNNEEDIRILGETLKFEATSEGDKKREKEASDFTYLLAETKYLNPTFNIPIIIKKPAVITEVKDSAINQNDEFWNSYRTDADARFVPTYEALDSLAQQQKVEKKLLIGRKIFNGYVPLGPIDVDLRYLLSYNNYEGFRFGFGGISNEQFSKLYRLEGYTAYGTKDGRMKYNLGMSARIGKFSNTRIGGSYTDDVREIASTSFAIDKRVFKIYDPRPINVSTFYNHVTWRGYVETKIFPKTESIWQLAYSQIEPKFNYIYNLDGKIYTRYNFTTAMVSFQWNPFSEYMQTPAGRLETEKRFPKFTFQFTQAIPGIFGNDFEFAKIDLRAQYEKLFLNGMKTAVLVESGLAFGDVPITHLYNSSPNNLNKDRLLQRITFAGKNSFETMFFNEFFSNKYVMLQLKHGSKRIEIFRKIKPSVVAVTRIAWGTIDDPQSHIGIDYKTLDNGYFESGIELNQIYNGLGLSGFYRYGANQLPRVEDNLSIKLSFVFNLGI
ncbi:MAG TPA: DUF5686 family protein [Flavobacterium sp.]|jgi:hypothetical protein